VPTWERSARFDRDWNALELADRARFRTVASRFANDLRSGSFRAGLRVKRVAGTANIYEMKWAPDGRATFEYGRGTPHGAHVIWRRIGRHEILREP